MAISFKHAFTSAKVDGTDSTLIQPSNWNAEHTLTMGAGKVLGRDASGSGAAQELAISVDATQQSMIPPSGSTAARPVTALAGMLRYNTSLSQFEGYYNSVWNQFPSLNGSNTFTGSMTLSSASGSYRFRITGPSGSGKYVVFQTAGTTRWEIGSNSSAETGGNNGSNLVVSRYDDAGTFLDTPFYINRDYGDAGVLSGFSMGSSTGPTSVYLTGGASNNRSFYLQSNYSNRWVFRANSDSESGSNAGSNFELNCYNDAGSFLFTPIGIARSTGVVTIGKLDITDYIKSGTNVGTNDGTYSSLDILGSAGQSRALRYLSGTGATSPRWEVGANSTAESGSNVGSDYMINRYSDAGTYIDTPVNISRSTGDVQIGTSTTATLSLTGANAQRRLRMQTNGSNRFVIAVDGVAESGSGAGSDFNIYRYNDSGVFVDTPLMIQRSSGNVLVTGAGGLGYGTGSGGTVTQTGSKTAVVALNKTNGRIIMETTTAIAAGASVVFGFNNTAIGATDVLYVTHSATGGTSGAYAVQAITIASGGGAANIRVTNISAGSLSEAVAINFVVIKAATS